MGRSPIEKAWLGAGVLAAVLLAVIGWFFFIGPQRSDTGSVQSQIADAQLANDGLQARINVLTRQSAEMPQYRKALKAAQQALPATSGLPDFLRTLQALGTATGTSVQSVSVGEPAELTPAAAPVAETSASSSAAPASAAPAPTGTGVYSLPITAQVSGSVKDLGDFLTQLQSVQPRAVLITAITQGDATAQGATAGGRAQSSLALTMQAWVQPPAGSTAPPQVSASAAAATP